MLKALGKLTKSKAIPASKDQLSEYRKEVQEKNRRLQELNKTDAIFKELKASYEKHKKDTAITRYKELTGMIETAIKELRSSESNNDRTNVKGKIGNLLRSAEAFAGSPNADSNYCEAENLSSIEVETHLKRVREESESFKKSYRQRRDILEDMDKKYQDALLMNPINRYANVKLAAKSSIEAYQMIPTHHLKPH